MRTNSIGRNLTMAAIAAMALAVAPAAKADNKGCTTATIKGTFSQKGTGYIMAPPALAGPIANVGTLVFDGNGGLTGTIVNSVNGNTIPPTGTAAESGTYKVNPDCTGTYTVQFPTLGLTGTAFFVIDDSGNELQILTTDPGVVILCVAKRQFPVGDWRQ